MNMEYSAQISIEKERGRQTSGVSAQPQDLISEQSGRKSEILSLINQAREGAEQAMELLLNSPEIRKICHRAAESTHGWWTPYYKDVDDLHQEVLMRIYLSLPLQEQFDSAKNFFLWVKTIARNLFISGLRNNRGYSERRIDLDGICDS